MPDTTYTPDALRALTDDVLRVVIAERSGWKRFDYDMGGGHGVDWWVPPGMDVKASSIQRLPAWPTDIAAVWELEGMVTPAIWGRYLNALLAVLCRTTGWMLSRADARALLRATPRQRCEAYVLATNPTEEAS